MEHEADIEIRRRARGPVEPPGQGCAQAGSPAGYQIHRHPSAHAGLLLVPSTLAAALALGLMDGATAWRSRGAARWGAIGMAGLCALQLGTSSARRFWAR